MIFPDLNSAMQRALEVARLGTGFVEPNPAVGAVVVDRDLRRISEGWHPRYGGPHAEIVALTQAGEFARGATLIVTLEPCAHDGKTPPCAKAVIAAGISRVYVAVQDPAPHVAGAGLKMLRQAGIEVHVGLREREARELIAPFTKLWTQGCPFVHAKWAMSLDGKIATRTGASQWISSAASRRRVHAIRGRMDAILVGINTALADDPLLTVRPAGPRVPTRIVLDHDARLPVDSQLASTAGDVPVLLFTRADPAGEAVQALARKGVEILTCDSQINRDREQLEFLLDELGRRRMTNVLVEGGSGLHGAFRDAGLIDEVHCFVAPKLVGGVKALSPMGGRGAEMVPNELSLERVCVEVLEHDVYINGRVRAGRDVRRDEP